MSEYFGCGPTSTVPSRVATERSPVGKGKIHQLAIGKPQRVTKSRTSCNHCHPSSVACRNSIHWISVSTCLSAFASGIFRVVPCGLDWVITDCWYPNPSYRYGYLNFSLHNDVKTIELGLTGLKVLHSIAIWQVEDPHTSRTHTHTHTRPSVKRIFPNWTHCASIWILLWCTYHIFIYFHMVCNTT